MGFKATRVKPHHPGKESRENEEGFLREVRRNSRAKCVPSSRIDHTWPMAGEHEAFMTRMCVSGDNTGTEDGLGNGVSFRQTVMLSMDH